MPGFLKRAMGLFVEFDNETPRVENAPSVSAKTITDAANMGSAEIDKFEKHFSKLFEETNLPGPDYFEFWRMMETLEKHIPDEKARIAATFASLSIQGLTKQTLVDTAYKYKEVIINDKVRFDSAVNDKAKSEIELRQKKINDNLNTINHHSQLIQELTKEISQLQVQSETLKSEIVESQNKIDKNKNGYNIACQAMINKIISDIKKIQETL
jgi:hypothetical protein